MLLQIRVKYLWIALVAVWGAAVGLGTLFLEAYAARPGEAIPSPDHWPEGSAIPRDARRPTLLIFLHPQCPCSLASVGELTDIINRCGEQVATQAVVLDTPLLESRGRSEIHQALARLPRITIRKDRGGIESRRFNVTTSGHVLLYEVDGRLVFSGGITAARGHRGDSFGRSALLSWIRGGGNVRRQSCVFGCPLVAARSKSGQESRP
jgi:hypothetical protein